MMQLRNVAISRGKHLVGPINFSIASGEYAVLVGQTGVGKTSVLEVIAGLAPLSCGQILIDGVDVSSRPPSDRGIGYVPQDYALFNSRTVAENLAFGLRRRRISHRQIRQMVAETATQLGVEHILNRKPLNLSGGEKQRVALGRALILRPRVLLLDEPFCAVDAATRMSLRNVVESMHRQFGCTVLHVSHDVADIDQAQGRLLQFDGSIIIDKHKARRVVTHPMPFTVSTPSRTELPAAVSRRASW